MPAVKEERLRGCVKAPMPPGRLYEEGDGGGSISPPCGSEVPKPGEDDKEPALKGWNETEGLRAIVIFCIDSREVCTGLGRGLELDGGELDPAPISVAARSADMGLEAPGGACP